MTQKMDKRCLRYQVLGLMVVLILFSGSGDTERSTFGHGSGEEPLALAVQRPCGPEHEGFCLNGVCTYSSELDTPICRCNEKYSGARCEHIIMDTHGCTSPEEIIGITCGVILLLGTVIGLMYCCLKKRFRRSPPPYKNCGSENAV